jgi:hypothetical protein
MIKYGLKHFSTLDGSWCNVTLLAYCVLRVMAHSPAEKEHQKAFPQSSLRASQTILALSGTYEEIMQYDANSPP